MQIKNIKSAIITLLFGLTLFSSCFAEGGIGVATDGGLQVGNPKTDPYWFNVSGVLKVDERIFTGDTATTPSGVGKLGTYISSTFIRDLGLTFEGGIGQDFSYTLAFDFDTDEKRVAIDYAYLTYYGLNYLLPNLSFSVGQVVPGFCLTCAASSKWIPFMERSMGTTVFGPKQGIGANANTFDDHYSATIAVTQQPQAGGRIFNVGGTPIITHDLWQASGRFTWAPVSQIGKVLQLGLSAHIQEYANTGLQFRANPEMKSRDTVTLLNTTNYNSASGAGFPFYPQTRICALNQKTIDFEVLGVYGPWSGEVEVQRAYITRGTLSSGVKQGKNLQFSGYHAQASYILTGETRPLKKANGTLGQIKPIHKYGAFEVSARYSFIGLNDQDITGGRANNTTGSVGWYINNNIKLIAEYVYSLQRRQFPTYEDRRHVGGMGARMQLIF
jgi:phosphate-selective porin OprO/OprP